MELETPRFGTVRIVPEEIIVFPEGIFGFEEYHRYVVITKQDSVFRFLQCVDEPELAFILLMPELIRPDYSVVLSPSQTELLKLDKAEDASVLSIVTIPANLADMTANLQAPLVINNKEKLGRQLVLNDGDYHTRHNILAEMQKANYEKQKADQGKKRVAESG